MSNPNIIYVRALDCFKSPHNVRTQSDEAADAELEANIGETGMVLQNLIGVKVPRQRNKYEIYGGGRRLEGVHRNITSGKLPEDFMVAVHVLKSADDAIQMSLVENYHSLAMNPADECRAFQTIIERENKTPADLAKRLGVTEKFVLGRLRLANLAEPVFAALQCGDITLDVAKAYASTADTDRQTKVFEQLAESYYGHNVNEIRRSLAAGSYKGADPKALFVGREAYEVAGGRIEGDLFSDTASEVWRDGEILDRLVEEKLGKAAEAMRQREGVREVRTVAASSVPYSETFQLARVTGTPVPMSEEAERRKAEIEAEIDQIEAAAAEVEDYTEEQSDRLEALEEELGGIVEPACIVSDEERASAIAYLIIGPDGEPVLHEQLYVEPADSAEVDGEGEDNADGGSGDPDDEDEAVPPGETYSQRLRDELAIMKTELLALHIANDPPFALDLGIFIMVDDACRLGYNGMPSELRAKAPSSRVTGFESQTAAANAWAELDKALDRSWLDHREIHERYDAFCSLEDAARAAWLGWAVARTIHAVPEGQTGSTFLSHLGAKLGIDVAAWWRPTARNFFDRLTKPAILKLLEVIGGPALKSRYGAARKFDLAVSAEKLFAGDVIADVDVKEKALAWLPMSMRFISPANIDNELVETPSNGTVIKGDVDKPQTGEGLPEAA
ncbi:ParB/RepB/Spo0J family partition protein [Novosphingobium sp. G106]|uniref:ParB/RepB/Spo0J family partition protein n=1 Tax=Novosphingobium sp. G106 TaxID=2849500 RepID=UPI001C2DCCB0|nr:ParB N-terminal domain-containing protein [Novosphingobium sp. G106]MBV1686418.1 ParB/RepB/Spo0J family partition protein [Novosphingobium sp. G106]